MCRNGWGISKLEADATCKPVSMVDISRVNLAYRVNAVSPLLSASMQTEESD